jgi:peptidyl-dipeptidase Dcp
MDSFVDQNGLTGTKPVVVNVMGIVKAPGGEPTLLSYDDVQTMFHEMGHAIHGLFSATKYPLLSGTNVPRDYVEFPSQANEDWALDTAVLTNYARHYQNGEVLPEALLKKLQAARSFNQGFASLEYIAAAELDMAWHELTEAPTDALAFEQEALKQAGVDVALVPPRYRSSYFAHVFPGGYSAGYYAYLWAEAIAADAFRQQMQLGGLKREVGDAYRAAILSRGYTLPPMEAYRAWRGADPTPDALLIRRGLKEG